MKVLNRTKLDIGDKGILSNLYSGGILKIGDEVEIIGKENITEQCYDSFIFNNQYFYVDETILSTLYIIKTFSPLTGEIVPHTLHIDEIENGFKGPDFYVGAENFQKNSELSKKLYKICMSSGEIGLAQMFLCARQLKARKIVKEINDKRKELAKKVAKVLSGEVKVA